MPVSRELQEQEGRRLKFSASNHFVLLISEMLLPLLLLHSLKYGKKTQNVTYAGKKCKVLNYL